MYFQLKSMILERIFRDFCQNPNRIAIHRDLQNYPICLKKILRYRMEILYGGKIVKSVGMVPEKPEVGFGLETRRICAIVYGT